MIESLKTKDEVMLAPQTVTDGATVTANLDCVGADWAKINVLCSAEESTHAANSTISLSESDDTVVTNFATVTANTSLDLTASKQQRFEVDLRGRKRYLRLSFTAGTTTGGDVDVAAVASLGRLAQGPGSTSDMVASTSDGVTVV